MRTSNTMLMLLALCWDWSGSAATVLNFLQYGTGAAATYGLTLNPVGTLVTAGIGGAAALGVVAGLALASRRNSRIYRRPYYASRYGSRYGRSLREDSGATELILEIVEGLDNDGCAKRLLCEEAAREAQLRDQRDASSPPQEEEEQEEEIEKTTEDLDLDEISQMMLQFIKGGGIYATNAQSSTAKMMSAINAGMDGENCTSMFPSCKFNRTQILQDLHRIGIL